MIRASFAISTCAALVSLACTARVACANTFDRAASGGGAGACALGHRPDLLVLDEPVASLDPIARRDFLRSVLELTEDESRTVLFSTHITSDLERVATHVAILLDGRSHTSPNSTN